MRWGRPAPLHSIPSFDFSATLPFRFVQDVMTPLFFISCFSLIFFADFSCFFFANDVLLRDFEHYGFLATLTIAERDKFRKMLVESAATATSGEQQLPQEQQQQPHVEESVSNAEVRLNTLRCTIAQQCLDSGWHGITESALAALTHVLDRYLRTMARRIASYTELGEVQWLSSIIWITLPFPSNSEL